jgi:glutamine amidotransferase
MIAVVDYHAGNLTSVKRALNYLGADAIVTSSPDTVARAGKIIVPGVGHFSATARLEEGGLKSVIAGRIRQRTPFLGICLGMQWIFESSQEAPGARGLGLLPGECSRFPGQVKSPHVGWNDLTLAASSRLLRGVFDHSFVYFTHSYRLPIVDATVAECDYGSKFTAAVEQDLVFGVQFHPEKSGTAGLKILENFCGLQC